MKIPIENKCISCYRLFCCARCRQQHEARAHGIHYDCCLCRGQHLVLRPEDATNTDLINHLFDQHSPLKCTKCTKTFTTIETMQDIGTCCSFTELVQVEKAIVHPTVIDSKFETLFNELNTGSPESMDSGIRESDEVTPTAKRNSLVDYDLSSDLSDEGSPKTPVVMQHTPYPKTILRLQKSEKFKRAASVCGTRLSLLMQQNLAHNGCNVDSPPENSSCHASEEAEITPIRNEADQGEMQVVTTPKSHVMLTERCFKFAKIGTTSTPTQAAPGGGVGNGWTFPEHSADSVISDINAESLAQSMIGNEVTKGSTTQTSMIKSILANNSNLNLTEPQESPNQSSSKKSKKVTFANDTVFERNWKLVRVTRKPIRKVTPGPVMRKQTLNPQFQKLIRAFENNMVGTPLRTVKGPEKEEAQGHIPLEHPGVPARAINFRRDSSDQSNPENSIKVIDEDKYVKKIHKLESNQIIESTSFKIENVLAEFRKNMDGMENCLRKVFMEGGTHTEMTFKFTILRLPKPVDSDGDHDNQNSVYLLNGRVPEIETIDMPKIESAQEPIISDGVEDKENNTYHQNGRVSTAELIQRSFNASVQPGPSESPVSVRKRKSSEIDPVESFENLKKTKYLPGITRSNSEGSSNQEKRHYYPGRISGRPPIRSWVPEINPRFWTWHSNKEA